MRTTGPLSGGPGFNLIQAPELVRRLQRALGIRQAHVAPTLNEGVQPVVVLADISREPVSSIGKVYRGTSIAVLAAGNLFGSGNLLNPPGSPVRLRVVSAQVSTNGIAREFSAGLRVNVAAGGALSFSTNDLPSIAVLKASIAQIITQVSAVASAPQDWYAGMVPAFVGERIVFDDLTLSPGICLGVGNRGVGAIGDGIFVTFEWREEAL